MKRIIIKLFELSEEFYAFILFVTILLSIVSSNSIKDNTTFIYKELPLDSIIKIALFNSTFILFHTLLSMVGIGIPGVIKAIYSIGANSVNFKYGISTYFLISCFHGFFEFYALFFVFKINIKALMYIYNLIYEKDVDKYVFEYKLFIIDTLSIFFKKIIIILFISSVVEVIISNRLLMVWELL